MCYKFQTPLKWTVPCLTPLYFSYSIDRQPLSPNGKWELFRIFYFPFSSILKFHNSLSLTAFCGPVHCLHLGCSSVPEEHLTRDLWPRVCLLKNPFCKAEQLYVVFIASLFCSLSPLYPEMLQLFFLLLDTFLKRLQKFLQSKDLLSKLLHLSPRQLYM